jgi:hypothetical protein
VGAALLNELLFTAYFLIGAAALFSSPAGR